MNNKKSKNLAVFFSLMPGAGHMYLGLLRQGLELMAIFFLGIFISDWLQMNIFMVIIPLVWFYSVFDVLNKTSSAEPLTDDDLPILSFLNKDQDWSRKGDKVIGIVLIVVGILCLIQRIIFPLADRFMNYEIRNYIQTGIVAILLIAGGIKLILGSKKGGRQVCNESGE